MNGNSSMALGEKVCESLSHRPDLSSQNLNNIQIQLWVALDELMKFH